MVTHHKHLTLGAVQLLIIVRDEMLLAQSVDGSWTAAEQHWSGGGGVRSWHAASCGELHKAEVDLCFNPKHKDIEMT